MPTYEYRCEKCNQTFDAFQSMKDEVYKTCPKELCRQGTWGEGQVKRLLGIGAGLIFKGSGFYTTDYRSAGYKEAAKKDSGPSTGGDSSKGGSGTPSTPSTGSSSKESSGSGSSSGSGGTPTPA